MTRAYIRLDPSFDEHKEAYPDGPYAALIATLCLAESQPERGRFRSERFLRVLLGKRGRHLPYLVSHGDVVTLPDGRLYVDGWDEWQEGDWKVGERVARIRRRPRGPNGLAGSGGVSANPPKPDVTPDVTVGVTPDVTVGTESGGRLDLLDSAGGGGGVFDSAGPGADYSAGRALTDRRTPDWMPKEHMPAYQAVEQATGYPMPHGGWPLTELDRLCQVRTVEAVVAAIPEATKRCKTQPPSANQLVSELRRVMEPYSNDQPKPRAKGRMSNTEDLERATERV